MADDTEWHTVCSHKHTAGDAGSSKPTASDTTRSNTRRKSKHKINSAASSTKKQDLESKSTTQQQRRPSQHVPHNNSKKHRDNDKNSLTGTRSTGSREHRRHNHDANHQQHSAKTASSNSSNPFHAVDDNIDSSDEEEEHDGQTDPIDLPVPPYHTTIVVSCPFKDCESPVPFLDTTSLVAHLKKDHHVIFKDLHHMYIALEAYLTRWAKELQIKPLSDYGYLKNEGESDVDKGEGHPLQCFKCINQDLSTLCYMLLVYVIDHEKCALDKAIRTEMQHDKLNEVLDIQQNERDYCSKQPRKCLFCKIICENRALLFKHMFAEHNFNIGLPDNLVYVNEFLDTLEAKLSKLQCLYCEKTFTSPAVLRKHMRKKKHFKIAAKNRQYDKFYVINYLEPGKNWENFENENDKSDDDNLDDSWADWEEDVQESTMCLFDTQVLPSPKDALEHMRKDHGFDLTQLRKEKGLDFYQTIVLINYIRRQSSHTKCFSCNKALEDENELSSHYNNEDCIMNFVPMDADFWKDPQFMIPTYENDPLLTGFEEENEEDEADDKNLNDEEANKRYLHQVMQKSLSLSDGARDIYKTNNR
ncbi:hypothetical protein BDF20DRAFT_885356 [Mycotypha africana]|uniref:uncharacterized protein n=1 Tax=Mycotypha africana TaxID=64632 RepID=UPI0022FFF222|nr:uncharacterized protein BDF20DRAFT_885356 [Mycotypha africana]KAI8971617.1 hypothetical protein BDF20DRAFT_885356 [Mycotypha africana]